MKLAHGQSWKLNGDKKIMSVGLPTKCKWPGGELKVIQMSFSEIKRVAIVVNILPKGTYHMDQGDLLMEQNPSHHCIPFGQWNH